jgi:hypothetical protein
MGDFQLILLSEVNRPARKARQSGAFSLIQFQAAGVAMATRRKAPEELGGIVFADWLTPFQALQILKEVFGENSLSKHTLLGRLRAGTVQAVAEMTVVYGGGSVSHPLNQIFAQEWAQIDTMNSGWITGDFDYERRKESGIGRETVSHQGVRFDPQTVRDIVKNATPVVKPIATSKKTVSANKGGAPRKEWWDDFWIAICGRIWEGDLKPKSQADLERVMLDWASMNGHEMSETSAKVAARKLFKAWKLGDKN